ncbi:hypothetical protein IWX50DRAFT_634279 [Phyllosticta citricarpa]
MALRAGSTGARLAGETYGGLSGRVVFFAWSSGCSCFSVLPRRVGCYMRALSRHSSSSACCCVCAIVAVWCFSQSVSHSATSLTVCIYVDGTTWRANTLAACCRRPVQSSPVHANVTRINTFRFQINFCCSDLSLPLISINTHLSYPSPLVESFYCFKSARMRPLR